MLRQPPSVLRAAPSARWLLLHGSAHAKALLHEALGGTEDPPNTFAAAAATWDDSDDEEDAALADLGAPDLGAPSDSITTSLNSFRPSPVPSRTGSSGYPALLNSRTLNGALPNPSSCPSCSPLCPPSHLGPGNRASAPATSYPPPQAAPLASPPPAPLGRPPLPPPRPASDGPPRLPPPPPLGA